MDKINFSQGNYFPRNYYRWLYFIIESLRVGLQKVKSESFSDFIF